MPELQISARYEVDRVLEARRPDYGTPVRWVWRVAWLPRGQYEKMRLDLSAETCREIIAGSLEKLYLDLDRAHSVDDHTLLVTMRGSETDDWSRDARWIPYAWPTPLVTRQIGEDNDTLMFCQRAFSLN